MNVCIESNFMLIFSLFVYVSSNVQPCQVTIRWTSVAATCRLGSGTTFKYVFIVSSVLKLKIKKYDDDDDDDILGD